MMMNIFESIILLVCVLDLFSIETTIAGSCFNQMHVYKSHLVRMSTTCGSNVNHMWVKQLHEVHMLTTFG